MDEIIKTQHNCVSDRTQYAGKLVRISHERSYWCFVAVIPRHRFVFLLLTVEPPNRLRLPGVQR